MFNFFTLRPSAVAVALVVSGAALSASAQTATTASPAAVVQPGVAPMAGAIPMNATASQPGAAASNKRVADRKFMTKAAASGMAEVEMGKLAQTKAANEQVKQFGARMEADHSKANAELKSLAASKNVELPQAPPKKEIAMMDKLKGMSGAEFDRAYMSHMVADHKKDVALFEKEASAGKDPQVKAFAGKTLPTLREHLQMAQGLHDSMAGADTGAKKVMRKEVKAQ